MKDDDFIVRIEAIVPTANHLPLSGHSELAYLTRDTGHLWVWYEGKWKDAGEKTAQQLLLFCDNPFRPSLDQLVRSQVKLRKPQQKGERQ
jgi:hypothetical protein